MSYVKLEQIKRYLEVTHDEDDEKLQDLINQAESEALQFLDLDALPRESAPTVRDYDSNDPAPVSDSDELAGAVRGGIYLLVQAMFEAKDADEMMKLRKAAEVKLMPFRGNLGV